MSHRSREIPRGKTWTICTIYAQNLEFATHTLAREETFGPIAPLFRFETEADAIRMTNDTEFGLAAYVYTRDLGRSWRVTEALEHGMVGLNTGLISTELAPFGVFAPVHRATTRTCP
ncbi:MAG TPA: aldehyde dehydrogenase family protein [Steroidobacter sp.]